MHLQAAAPEYQYIYVIGAALLFIIILISAGVFIGLKIRNKYTSLFRVSLSRLSPEYMTFYRRLYASCIYKGYRVYFTYAAAENSFHVILPGKKHITIIMRVKIPGTTGIKIHMAVFPDEKSGSIHKLLGWSSPEPCFFIAKSSGADNTGTLEIFHRLSASSKSAMKNIAEKSGSCGISPDWESVMIGKENSLLLAGGDESVRDLLDFQAKTAFDTSPDAIIDTLDMVIETVKLVSADLGR